MAGGIIIALLVFSHWLLDFITHIPDLELWLGGPKVGLGLWKIKPLSITLEFLLLGCGMVIYMKQTKPKGNIGAWAPFVLLTVMSITQLLVNFGPIPGSPDQAALAVIAAFVVFTILAALIDATRMPDVPLAGC